ncbi:response regulator [Kovacikia minuta]|uniref:response regulator n=1 Tax=Kovacikia minuta TaxID=2931930 RepID=UPI0020C7533E|nr:response regulator [Kovacikia minuta]
MGELLTFVLQQAGARVAVATSAGEALTILKGTKPDILLTDIAMPEIDGYMLLRQIRALAPEQCGQIPAIAITAYAGELNQRQILAAGFQRYIPKPIDLDNLIREIAQVLAEQ